MKTLRHLLAALFLTLAPAAATNAAVGLRSFDPICDSLALKLKERTGVEQKLKVTRTSVRGNRMDITFNAELSYYPWHKEDIDWFFNYLDERMLAEGINYRRGRVLTNKYELQELSLPELTFDGKPVDYALRSSDPVAAGRRAFVSREGGLKYSKGLQDRTIALWQSHGRYYDETSGEWIWQRACMHTTVEDMYTQSYVLPFLMPMLENAGAYVMTPRERDVQRLEIICDNDHSFSGHREAELRQRGSYDERGSWKHGGSGFADFKRSYSFEDNPFKAGSFRIAECNPEKASASVKWTPDIKERGEYAVYISYASMPNSCDQAHYTVRHLGGETKFIVDQSRGGGTWIYLGTFEFGEGEEGCVILDNRGRQGQVVSADAVKIGGGMGKLEREGKTSGMASSAEGAHYWMQWAGVDSKITQNWDNDYTNDYATRGLWTVMMQEEKGIPFDLSLAFHSDAGIARADSTVGTLAIYTLRADNSRKLPDGRDRMVSRLLCDYVQTQIVRDIRREYKPDWNRRGIWDKSYSECRTTGTPAMILELLSHQNFNDMKYGLDPSFRFAVCRAVYKGILKTLSEYYGCDYVVQPLPVRNFRAELSADGKRALLSWEPAEDELEATAKPKGYILRTRIGNGAFDEGVEIKGNRTEVPISRGQVYSFKIEAYNDGGKSFPSEVLSVAAAENEAKGKILVVNNFTKVSAPAWIDGENYAGFDLRSDSGVPYIRDISFVGENFEFNPNAEFVDNDYPGFGASHSFEAGKIIAGNSFDFVSQRAEMYLKLGYSVQSCSSGSFKEEPDCSGIFATDLICGKQGGEKYPIFDPQMRAALDASALAGSHLFVSGCYIASQTEDPEFCKNLFGYKLGSPHGSRSGMIGDMQFSSERNPEIYCIERPDGLKAASKSAQIWLRYPDTGMGAAVCYDNGKCRTVSVGVPLETVIAESDRMFILKSALEYFLEGSLPEGDN